MLRRYLLAQGSSAKQQTNRLAAIKTACRAYKCSRDGRKVRSGQAGVKARDGDFLDIGRIVD
jgi:hypothetical protein